MSARGDAGVATLVALGLALLLLAVATLGAGVAGVVVARHELAGTADLSALSGAATIFGGGIACDAAAHAAVAGHAELVRCAVVGSSVQVLVRRPVGGLVATLAAMTGRDPPALEAVARAGW